MTDKTEFRLLDFLLLLATVWLGLFLHDIAEYLRQILEILKAAK